MLEKSIQLEYFPNFKDAAHTLISLRRILFCEYVKELVLKMLYFSIKPDHGHFFDTDEGTVNYSLR
jgi:hypothetical protein